MTRALKLTCCRLMMGELLFAQMAVTAYACPGMSSAGVQDASEPLMLVALASIAEPPADATSHSDGPRDMNANLCAGHCQQGQQSADHAAAPAVAAALFVGLYTVPVPPEATGHVRPRTERRSVVAAAPLPHAIAHCCFRI